jgi:hypothetical protein
MSTIEFAPPASRTLEARPVARARHTTLLIALFLGLTLAGAAFQRNAGSHAAAAPHAPPIVPLYLSLLAGEWGLVLYVWRGGLRRSGTPLRELIGGPWRSARDVVRDLALGAGLWAVMGLVSLAWDRLVGTGHAAPIRGYLPARPIEGLLWVLLSLSAGFCEELVFRGYLQRQFLAWTRLPWLALILQALLFGVSHGYQGVMACAKIAVLGLLFGLMALWRGSLRPGMIAHALTDIVGGLFRL